MGDEYDPNIPVENGLCGIDINVTAAHMAVTKTVFIQERLGRSQDSDTSQATSGYEMNVCVYAVRAVMGVIKALQNM